MYKVQYSISQQYWQQHLELEIVVSSIYLELKQ